MAMGTEILYPRDCLIRQDPSFRRFHPHPHPSTNPNSYLNTFKKQRPRPTIPARIRASGRLGKGHVTILKRGESLSSPSSAASTKKAIESLISGRRRPDPGLVAYAGSAFWMSPSPGSLPLPRFSKRREEEGVRVDQSATRDLRRLLRLD